MRAQGLRRLILPSLLAAAVGSAGCSSRQVRDAGKAASAASAAEQQGAAGTSVPEPDVREASLRIVPEAKTIQFGYDSSYLEPESRAVLKQNAAWLKSRPGLRIQVAGHCDERGTVEYNLALGQRRAQAVRGYYKALGVPAGNIATISYGKEQPLCREPEAGCWGMNRRAETLVAQPR